MHSLAGNLVTLTVSSFKEIIRQWTNFRFLPLTINSLEAPSCAPVRCFYSCTGASTQRAPNLLLPHALSPVFREEVITMSSQYWKITHSCCLGPTSRIKRWELNSATTQLPGPGANFAIFCWLVPYRGFRWADKDLTQSWEELCAETRGRLQPVLPHSLPSALGALQSPETHLLGNLVSESYFSSEGFLQSFCHSLRIYIPLHAYIYTHTYICFWRQSLLPSPWVGFLLLNQLQPPHQWTLQAGLSDSCWLMAIRLKICYFLITLCRC